MTIIIHNWDKVIQVPSVDTSGREMSVDCRKSKQLQQLNLWEVFPLHSYRRSVGGRVCLTLNKEKFSVWLVIVSAMLNKQPSQEIHLRKGYPF